VQHSTNKAKGRPAGGLPNELAVVSLLPLREKVPQRADEGLCAINSSEAWDGAEPLTLENRLNADFLSLSLEVRLLWKIRAIRA
jgi:hypothetical protein